MNREVRVNEYPLRLAKRPRRIVLDGADSSPSVAAMNPSAPAQPSTPGPAETFRHWQNVIQQALRQCQAELQALRQALPRLAAELALFLLEETFGEGVAVSAHVWQKRIHELTEMLGQGEGVTLALHPDDWRWWQSEEAATLRNAIAHWKLVPDPRLRPGEYRVEWGELLVWWQWQERLAALRQTVLQRMEAHALE